MTVTKNFGLVREVERHLRGGIDKTLSVPPPATRFERLGTIFSRVTGLIKSGVMPAEDIPIWYHVVKTFPPKYEPTYSRPPMENIQLKEIYYPEDKLRAAIKKWDTMDLGSSSPCQTQKFVAQFREKRTDSSNDNELIKEILMGGNLTRASEIDDTNKLV